jgi:DnaK suppressor protein
VTGALTGSQLAELRADLERLETELGGQLERLGDDSRPVVLDQQSVGRLSRMDAMQQQQMAAASAGHIRAHLSRVRRALAALDSGDFGYCYDCGEAIAFPRLKARPDSPLCVGCQARNEN